MIIHKGNGMNKLFLSLLLFAMVNTMHMVHASEQVTPEQQTQIESLQHRAAALSFDALDVNSYHLAKATTWLDLATSEYYDNDTTGIVSAAIRQASNIIEALENKQTNISMTMPVQTPGSETVRPELWDRIATLKNHAKFSCGQTSIAQAEVYLVWAGHEYAEAGESHAQTYMRNVEDRLYDGQVAMDNCAATAPVITTPVAPPPLDKITLSGDALFAFNKATLNPSALWRLDELADKIKTVTHLDEVVLVGHTDRLRSDGHPERNQLLSEQRAESIKQYLVGKGIPAEKIHASGAGSTQPLVQCSTRTSKQKQIECLQPNRRVEIILRGTREKFQAPVPGDAQGNAIEPQESPELK